MKKSTALHAALMLSLTSAGALAEESPTQLDPIVVRGDLIAHAVQEALDDRRAAPNAVVVIDGEQLNQFNDLSVGDAIRRLPGVTFPGVNRSRDVRLRAIGGEYTQILVDGRPFLDGNSSRNLEVDRIPAAMIERIEIVRSPTATTPGGGAAGTINIITKRDFSPRESGISAGAGHVERNGETGDIALWQGGVQGGLRWFLSGNAQRRLLDESATEFDYTAAGDFDGGSDQWQQRSFDEYTVTGRLSYDLNDRHRLELVPSWFRTTEIREQLDRALDDTRAVGQTSAERRERVRETLAGRLEWAHRIGQSGDGRLHAEYSDAKEDTVRDSERFNAAGVSNRVEQRLADIALESWNTGYVLTAVQGRHALEAGIGHGQSTRDEAERNFRDGRERDPSFHRIYEVSETLSQVWGSDVITLSAQDQLAVGLRVERSRTRTTGYEGTSGSETSTDWLPSLQYRRTLTPDVDLRVGVARTVRRPDLRDLTPTVRERSGTLSDPDTSGNPETQPERAWGLDTGIDWYLEERRGLVAANLFVRRIEDKIESRAQSDGTRWLSRPENVGEGTLWGVELEGRLPFTFLDLPDLVVWANATRVHSELTDQSTGLKRRFDQQPSLVSNVGLDYFLPTLRTTLGVNFNRVFDYTQAFENRDGEVERTRFSAQNRLDLSARTQLTPSLSLAVSALNIAHAEDRRSIQSVDSSGALGGRVESYEGSNATYYARLKYIW